MSGLSPPLFELLFDELPLLNQQFISKYPLVHLALFKAAKYFTEVNQFFSNVSNLLKSLPVHSQSDSLFTIPEARHSKCLSEIFVTLSTLLHYGTQLSNDTIEAVLLWSQAISNSLGDSFQTLLYKPQLLKFRTELLFFTFVGNRKPLRKLRVLDNMSYSYF